MKKLSLLLAFGAIIISTQAQTIIYSENFEGGAPTFTLNTADLSSGNAFNTWLINNSYTGGSFDDNLCGFGTIPVASTPTQPGAITNSPTSKYLHLSCIDAASQGVDNANFAASIGIPCSDDENNFAKMTSDISTTGQTGVTVSFYWMCVGSSATYGELYYSTNAGSTWNLQQGNMQGQASWTQANITNAIFDNKPTLRFGFRFVNTQTFSAGDPPLCVDEFSIFVPAAGTIATGDATTGSPYCAGESIILPYTITGTYTAGNVFTAQLSDGAGSFASPTTIGSVTTTSAGNINCTLPTGTASGVGYQIRVVSSTPAVTGTTSAPITINALPVPAPTNTGPYCAGATISLNAASVGADFDWTGPNSYIQNNTQNPTILNSTVAMSGAYTVTVTTSTGCTSSSSTTVTVNSCVGIEDNEMDQVNLYPNPTTDVFTIAIGESMINEAKISIINLVGEQVYTTTANQSKTMISTESLGLKAGIYLIRIKYKDQNKVMRLIVR